MKMPQLVLLLLVLMNAAAGFPVDRRDKQASWDDVNVVAHGLLQLGQGLKEHVDKTKVQMRDITGKLKAFNSTITALERKQQEKDDGLKVETTEVKAKVEEVMKQNKDIHSRMDRLEEKMEEALQVTPNASFRDANSAMPFIQRVLAAQNRRIDQLVDKIRQQQDKLEKHSLHLQALQDKVASKRVKFHRRRDEETTLRGDAAPSDTKNGVGRDCHDLFVHGQRASGIYTIQPLNSQPFNVLCEITSEGGWTIIQKRLDGSQSFNHLWESYKKGFGSLNGEFWLGLDNIHAIAQQGQYLLQVELSDWAGQMQATRYQFRLDGEEEKYALHLEQESTSGAGEEESILTGASGLPFSTVDSDNDLAADANCAELHSGGWWFSGCGASNLNGKYPRRLGLVKRSQPRRMFWVNTRGENNPLRTTLLKLAPTSINQQ
ncbi:angiopoietin-related protein 4-like [Dunckerocampus dactyliophorus]|uniref:angiopoietin-related protein 4-like n=1 Tax=Dunckerocampus dactyliophorus TaxID=161453 RepID=UPI002406792A|nr:angiopoietin-related protein 4-like [Dunckerocampus dactyliophorus]